MSEQNDAESHGSLLDRYAQEYAKRQGDEDTLVSLRQQILARMFFYTPRAPHGRHAPGATARRGRALKFTKPCRFSYGRVMKRSLVPLELFLLGYAGYGCFYWHDAPYPQIAVLLLLTRWVCRLYRWGRPAMRPGYRPPLPGERGFNLYADNADGSRNYPY